MATVFCSVADLGGLTELLELLRLVRPVQGHAAISSCCGSGRSFTPRGGSPTVPQLMAGRWARGSRGCGDDHDAMERVEDLAGPGPVARQPELAAPATAAQPGGNLQHLEPQQLRLDDGQVTGQGEQPQPGGQVGGEGDELQPGLVDGVLP